ncbi:MAG TPA: ComEA family DNA-binding protein [Solirubrobacterales bacterium]|jgi:competence protein ComEA|nr:ComEA family DNA-binding protein [Solirubrobacterales bacterium]
MASLTRTQLLVYGAVAVTLLLVGARWIRSSQGSGTDGGAVSYPSTSGSSSSDPGSSDGSFSVDEQGGDVVVDVAGAVAKPGVYRMPAGARVNDAVQRAGGATGRANVEGINLAARLSDGQQIVVPGKDTGSSRAASAAAAGASSEAPIGLGTATLEQLDTIEGIGPITAQKILEFRDQHGGISSLEQLDQIDGIGPATMEALRPRLQP